MTKALARSATGAGPAIARIASSSPSAAMRPSRTAMAVIEGSRVVSPAIVPAMVMTPAALTNTLSGPRCDVCDIPPPSESWPPAFECWQLAQDSARRRITEQWRRRLNGVLNGRLAPWRWPHGSAVQSSAGPSPCEERKSREARPFPAPVADSGPSTVRLSAGARRAADGVRVLPRAPGALRWTPTPAVARRARHAAAVHHPGVPGGELRSGHVPPDMAVRDHA